MRFHTQYISSLIIIFFFGFTVILLRERQKLYSELITFRAAIWEKSFEPPVEEPEAARWSRRILPQEEHLIFIGGMPRSGTTLMRVMLDAHKEIRCGDETMLIPLILNFQRFGTRDLHNSTLTRTAINDAVSAFILELIAKNGPLASRLCNKDPFTALHVSYLQAIFPNARFILMLRDPRAIIHSMMTRNVAVAGFNLTDPYSMLEMWQMYIKRMFMQCRNIPGTCLPVFYERLVQAPEDEAARILSFLQVDWDPDVLRHHELMGSEIQINPKEYSASQVKEQIYKKALTAWFDFFPDSFLEQVDSIAPFMTFLGYDAVSKKPDYSLFGGDDFYEYHSYS